MIMDASGWITIFSQTPIDHHMDGYVLSFFPQPLFTCCCSVGTEGMNPGASLKDTTRDGVQESPERKSQGMVYRSHSLIPC